MLNAVWKRIIRQHELPSSKISLNQQFLKWQHCQDSPSAFNVFSSGQPRTRRFSASFSPGHNAGGPAPRLTPRVSQLRQEECVDLVGREAAQERELHSTMQMSQSWEDLTLVPSPTGAACKTGGDQTDGSRKVMNRVMEPIHLTLPLCSPMCSSPSPTRSGLGRQCFSPGMHHVWKSGLSPSPTRKAFATRRSQSPIAMRQSSLGPVKRKFDLEEEKADQYISPPTKRPNCFGSDRGGLLMAHNNMLDTASSPLPGSLSSVGTPESLSSADSPGFTFRPLDSPSPGRPIISSSDEPMQEEIPKQDQIMTSVEASIS
uniref:Protein FAM122A n=1 Tax=Timema shepardi TaxID=629360 RepID=A0A7R9AU64_TIMSH|nr:unnamed protein product [Timema shepardi]